MHLRTPRNLLDFESHSTHMMERIRRHQGSLPTSIMKSMIRYTRGAKTIVYEATLVSTESHSLRKTAEAAISCRSRKRRSIQKAGALTIEEGA